MCSCCSEILYNINRFVWCVILIWPDENTRCHIQGESMKKIILFLAVTGVLLGCGKEEPKTSPQQPAAAPVSPVAAMQAKPTVPLADKPANRLPPNAKRESIFTRIPALKPNEQDLFVQRMLNSLPESGSFETQKIQFIKKLREYVKSFSDDFCVKTKEQIEKNTASMLEQYKSNPALLKNRRDFMKKMTDRACQKAQVSGRDFYAAALPLIKTSSSRTGLWSKLNPVEAIYLKQIQTLRETYQMATISALSAQMPIRSITQNLQKEGFGRQAAELEQQYLQKTNPYIDQMIIIFERKSAGDTTQPWEKRFTELQAQINKQTLELMSQVSAITNAAKR